jgi:diacylglycerol kinase (ATP)
MKNNYLVLCNPESGKGNASKVCALFEQFLVKRNVEYQLFLKSYPSSLVEFTSLVIIGGDGTLNHVLNHFGTIKIPIAIIKGGTGNDYASLHLGNAKLEEQFENALSGTPMWVDAGNCNGKLFINGAGIGFDGWVVKSSLGKKFFTGMAAYYSTILSLLLFYKESKVHISHDGEQFQSDMFMMSIAKGVTYGGGFKVAPMAQPNNGVFDIITIHKIGLLNRLRYLPVIEKGKHMHLPFVHHMQGTKLHIKAPHPLQAHLDGEWLESQEFEVALLPKYFQFRSITLPQGG